MRSRVWTRPALIACTALSLGAAITVARSPADGADEALSAIPAVPSDGIPPSANADSLARVAALRDPFRIGRAPAAQRYDPEAGAPGWAPPPAAPRPSLSLAGIVMGQEPEALVDGLPGVDGTRVLRIGERVGDFFVREIRADRVVIAGRDTTWTLRLRARFQ